MRGAPMRRTITEMTNREFSRLHEAHEDRELDAYLKESQACLCDDKHCSVCVDWSQLEADDETP